jgi:hypothetical protein
MKAKVRNILVGTEVDDVSFVQEMCNNIGKIIDVRPSAYFPGCFKDDLYVYDPNWLEFVDEEKNEVKNPNKYFVHSRISSVLRAFDTKEELEKWLAEIIADGVILENVKIVMGKLVKADVKVTVGLN